MFSFLASYFSTSRFRLFVSSLRRNRISPSCAQVIRSTAYICEIYCHSVRTLRGAPTSPRRGLFATSSATPGMVEGVHHCAAAIPCAPRRYPLSAFKHTYTQRCTHAYTHAANLPPLRRGNRVCGCRLSTTYLHTRMHTCLPLLSFNVYDWRELPRAQTPQRRISSSH